MKQAILLYLIMIKRNRLIRKERVIYNNKIIESSQNNMAIEWTEEDDQKLFMLYKEEGSHWSVIAQHFLGLNENQVKNRFYSTLRRLATKKALSNPNGEQFVKTKKKDLIEFVDEAILYGHSCRSKRGRKRKQRPIELENVNANNQKLVNKEFNEDKLAEVENVNTPNNKLPSNLYGNLRIKIKEDNENKEDIKSNTPQEEESKEEITKCEGEISLGYLSLENTEFVQRLLVQNDSILNEYEEVTRDQSTELEELLELEKEMEKRLKTTQQLLNFIPSESFIS